MYEDYRTIPSYAAIQFWKRIAFVNGVIAFSCVLFVILSASGRLDSSFNLYYLLWKAGLREYEPEVALGGLYDDLTYRQHFIGMTKDEFMRIFPMTFWEVKKPAPSFKARQESYVTDYAAAETKVGGGAGWTAIFENGKLVEFDYHEGV